MTNHDQPDGPDAATVAGDLRAVLGGNFNRDALQATDYEEIAVRVAGFAPRYLAAFEETYLGGRFDPRIHARIFAPTLVGLLKDRGRTEYRELAEALLRHYEGALVIYDDADRQALAEVLPQQTSNLLVRLDDRRNSLRRALEGEG
ncbi:hypothetical protein [Amycolatopsis minnesotensis]|uniref:Uncharacterized protein n=1 Tax=Amycolatopsis minnesotensis TaxID=337894 RepID=A0ABN2QKF8_9PSEU